jgi:hypothetical protein
MAAVSVPDLYAQYLNRLILHGLQGLAGMPRNTATDEKTFRQAAIDPVWASLCQLLYPLTQRGDSSRSG